MSLQVLIVHVGERLSADPPAYPSLDAFKAWLSTASSVPVANQILLTASGKQAKFNTLHLESELFLYNRQLLFASHEEAVELQSHRNATPEPLPSPPDTLTDPNNLDSWKQLFKARRSWALNAVERTADLHKQLRAHADAITVMKRGVGVAIGNLDSHISNLEQRHGGAREWSDGLIQEQQELLDAIPDSMRHLKSLPADTRFFPLIPLLGAKVPSQKANATLDDFFDSSQLQDATKAVRVDLATFADRSGNLSKRIESVIGDAATLFENVEKSASISVIDTDKNVAQLLEEVQVLADKIASDSEHVSTLTNAQRSVSQASKMALHHTREYLPALREYYHEMGDCLNKIISSRNRNMTLTAKNMREIAALEAAFSEADGQVKRLDFATEDETRLSLLSLVPQFAFVYGALLLESVRRREWNEKIRSESATLAEDIAGYREEEEKRRKKWARHIGGVISEESAVGRVLDFELNLQAHDSTWPEVSREDVQSYIEKLRSLGDAQVEAVQELDSGLHDLDRPSKRQLKMAKNFKGASLHEACSGKGSFLFRENDEVKALRESNSKLEDDIKSQKSRVRKLEDLLYRQTQGGRPASANNLFPGPPGPDASPQQPSTPDGASPTFRESLSRQASHNSRRPSGTRSSEEKALARRIVSLEADLHQEKQKRQELEAAATGRQETSAQIQTELEDTRSTKRDLMANLEAQQREFSAERRLLEENIQKQRLRIEELEDDIEKVLGSRDNSRLLVDEKTRNMESELEHANRTISLVHEDMKRNEDIREENIKSLRAIFTHASPDTPPPAKMEDLINSLEELIERTIRQARDLNQTVAATRSEKDELQMVLDRKDKDALETKDRVQALELESTALRNDHATEKARATSLNEELVDGRQQLKDLRAKFAEGETGSEALRLRVEEQAARASALATDLAKSKSHINSLDVELTSLQRKHRALVKTAESANSTIDRRNIKSKELTNRLVAYHHELVRLLDALNLSIMRRDGALFIQRSSKLANQSTTTLPDASGSVQILPPFEPFDASINQSLLSWTHAETDREENEKFSQLLSQLDDFNLTTFSEAVIKLRRDVEWTGKKWKMEARNYRDKYHKAQSEGRDKIAYRSFKEGDLALFLPTRNQATRPWAAFNVGAPHYFLRERDVHHLRNREWLVARVQKIDDRVVDLSKNMSDSLRIGDRRSVGETSEGASTIDDDNPFGLSDGLRWYLLDAAEDKPGAPATPGLGKSTVASVNVDAEGTKPTAGGNASSKLNKSLESRRSSTNSKRGSISGGVAPGKDQTDLAQPSSPTVVQHAEGAAQKPGGRPGSRSSGHGHGPSGLGVELSQDAEQTGGPSGDADEHSRDPAKALAATSPPAAGLLGLFGSPPRTWLRRGNSFVSHASHGSQEDKNRQRLHPHDGPSTAAQRSPAKSQGSSPPKPRPSPARVHSTDTANLPIKSSKGKSGGWESLWSLDLNLEEKGKGRGA